MAFLKFLAVNKSILRVGGVGRGAYKKSGCHVFVLL